MDWLSQQVIDDNQWVYEESLRAEIRRLRAMVLRAHALGKEGSGLAGYRPLHNALSLRLFREARLLNHYASAIESGRL
jgi:hypothetical protein